MLPCPLPPLPPPSPPAASSTSGLDGDDSDEEGDFPRSEPPRVSFQATGHRYVSVRVGKVVCADIASLASPFFTFWVVDRKGKVLEVKQFSPPVLFRQREYAWAGFTFWLQVRTVVAWLRAVG